MLNIDAHSWACQGLLMTLGKKICEIRKKEGLSQKAFAEETGVSFKSVRNYEQGVSTVSEANLLKITNSNRFKKYTLWLMTDDEEPEGDIYTGDENVFTELIQSISDDELNQVIEYMEFLISKRK